MRIELAPDGHGGAFMNLEHAGFQSMPDGAKPSRDYQQGWGDRVTKLGFYVEEQTRKKRPATRGGVAGLFFGSDAPTGASDQA